jgi:hypothetical protein
MTGLFMELMHFGPSRAVFGAGKENRPHGERSGQRSFSLIVYS